jgi:hypothetical protein
MAAGTGTSTQQRCTWCGSRVEPDDGFRAAEHPGDRVATFCRLEHIVPWTIQGPHWEAGTTPGGDGHPAECAQCGTALGDVYIVLVRHRGDHRVADSFCSAEHMGEWAKGGGRWR